MSTNDDADGREDEVRGPRRIPGPRAAADDFDLDAVPLPAPRTDPAQQGAPEPEAEPESTAEPAGPAGPTELTGRTAPTEPPAAPALATPPALVLPHRVLKSLLGAWALAACSAEETEAVEAHLTECAACADEALRLRDAVGLLHTDGSLDLDPMLRSRVLDACLSRRPAKIPVPDWAAPYDAETARLDALLRDIGGSEWHAPVRLKWFERERAVNRKTTVAGVIGHLMTVDGLVGTALGLDDPLGNATAERGGSDSARGGGVPLSPARAPRRTGRPPGARPPGPSAGPGASRATPSSARCPSPPRGRRALRLVRGLRPSAAGLHAGPGLRVLGARR